VFFFFGGKDFLHDPSDEFARWIVYIGALFALAGAVFLCLVSYQGKTARDLRTRASAARGRVTGVKRDWLSRGYALNYSFVDPIGRTYRGKKILSQQEAFTWRDGEEGEIRYDSHAPGKSVWIGRGIEFEPDESVATCVGMIIEVIERNLDGEKQSVVHYRYRDHLGEVDEDQFVETESALYNAGDRGRVEFHLRHPGLNQWLGKTEDPGLAGSDTAASPRGCGEAANLDPRSVPSTFPLLRRSKSLKSASLIFVYVLIAGFFLLLFAVAKENPSADDMIGLRLYALGFAALIVWFLRKLVLGIRDVKSWKHILRSGAPARGTVNLVEEKRQRLGRWTWTPGWIISYRYSDMNGRVNSGESAYLSGREAARWRTRDSCLIVYDPERPESSVWIGKP
jgi:hypothetical protein